MDDVAMVVVGAAAAATVLGKGLRPVAKLAMRGVVSVTEATSAGRRGLQDLYTEVKREREQRSAQDTPVVGAEEPPRSSATTPMAG